MQHLIQAKRKRRSNEDASNNRNHTPSPSTRLAHHFLLG
jgi:hypothetical protein